jgi:hypothetical protein
VIKRKLVSASQLNAWLTARIQMIVGDGNCTLTWNYRLQEPEKNGGCNWSGLTLRFGENTHRDVAFNAAHAIGREAFEEFNLEEESPPMQLDVITPSLTMLPRLLVCPLFHLDTNLINARQNLDAVNRLERWRDDGVILLAMAGAAYKEAQSGSDRNAKARRRKAASYIYTINENGEATADETYLVVEALLWGRALRDNQANDVKIIRDAILCHAILVTSDGGSRRQPRGILGNRDQLREQFNLQILKPDEAVEFVRTRIAERDEFNAQVAALMGDDLPNWYGSD